MRKPRRAEALRGGFVLLVTLLVTAKKDRKQEKTRKEKPLQSKGFGEPGGIRTHDLLIRRQKKNVEI